jgi:type IV pilus assembly protein PilQ
MYLVTHHRMLRATLAVSLAFATSVEAEPLNISVLNQSATTPALSSGGRSVIASTKNGVGVQVARLAQADQISIDTGAQKPVYEVTRLNNPPRLVVDLTSHKIASSKNVPIADLDLVSRIRIGAQPTSGRIVLDLTEGQDVQHTVETRNGKIIVTLSTANGSSIAQGGAIATKPSAPVVGAKSEPRLPDSGPDDKGSETDLLPSFENAVVPASLGKSAKQKNTENPSSKKLQEVNQIGDTSTVVEEVSILPISASTSTSQVHVKSVRLNAAEGTSSVVAIDVESAPEFTIERTAPSEYVLTLKNATLPESALSATLFAESQKAAIRSVRSTVRGKDALVRIFAQPEIYLTARVVGSQVIVEETKDLRQVVDDMRAQLAPKDGKIGTDKNGKDTAVAAKVEPASKNEAVEEMSDVEVRSLLGDTARYTGKLISLDLQDTDIDNALRIIAEVSNLNIVASEEVIGKVTLRLTDVPWDQALDVILKTHGLDRVLEGNVMRIAPIDKLRIERESLKQAQIAENELAQLLVKYIRVSYGKASELKSLVETVLSERGTVAYDERSNQLIIKDIQSGVDNVTELVAKVDLRTPQVLLETQIVEASRNLTRDLGAELGFQYIQSPATGNGTGLNFPAAVSVGGTLGNGIAASAFPAAVGTTGGSAIGMLFDSADGTKTLELRLTQMETEGRIRIVSRPAVATTNNKPAEIKSVEKYRIRLPSGGTSVATGQGSTANGTGGAATEVIEAGIVLNVTPQASPDYYILLDIKAKSSTFGNSSVEGIPNEIERSASSSVLVSSGQTFALGGIYKLTDKDDVAGMPFFKDIPVLGTFFRRLQTIDTDEELLFFITPRIVEGSFDDSSMKSAS